MEVRQLTPLESFLAAAYIANTILFINHVYHYRKWKSLYESQNRYVRDILSVIDTQDQELKLHIQNAMRLLEK